MIDSVKLNSGNIEVFLEHGDQYLPSRANPTDAGLDLRARKTITVAHLERVLVPTGVRVKIPVGYVGLLVARSSLSKRGLMLTNAVGIIDSDYRGEIMASMTCTNVGGALVEDCERIVQLVITPTMLVHPKKSYQDLASWESSTCRGVGGFGSSGRD